MLLLISKSFLYHVSSPNFEQSLVTGPEKRKPAVLMLSVLKKIPGVGFQRIFGYVILQKILLLMIPKLALYNFFPGRTHYLSSTAILLVLSLQHTTISIIIIIIINLAIAGRN